MIFVRYPSEFYNQYHYPRPMMYCGKNGACQSTKEVPNVDNKDQHEEVHASEPRNKSVTTYQGRNMQVEEHENELVLYLDLPGVKPSDLQLSVIGDVLHIKASRKIGAKQTKEIEREFVLGRNKIDKSDMNANLSNGILTVHLPKKEAPSPIELTVLTQEPPLDNSEDQDADDKKFCLQVDLPGVKAENIKIKFVDDVLKVFAERHRGRFAAKFDRRYPVDSNRVDTAKLGAYLMDGVLTVLAPHKEMDTIQIPVSYNSDLKQLTPAPADNDEKEIVVETVDKEEEYEDAAEDEQTKTWEKVAADSN